MSLLAASALLVAPPQAGADFASTEVEEQVEHSPSADHSEEADHGKPDHPEAKLYDASINATAAVDAALALAEARGVNALIVLGANWCHDSRAFAGWSVTPRIGGMIAEKYQLLFINVGMPQTGDGHNLHIAERFKLGELEGTPTVVVLSPDGTVLNRDTAKSWRNTASRSENEIFDELALLATAEIARE